MISRLRVYPLVGLFHLTVCQWGKNGRMHDDFDCPGAHSVHQFLHHASRLPEGVKAPFQSAILQSNSIV